MKHTVNTNKMTRHVGYYNDKRCALVLQLPETPNEVHIIETESLPDQLHQNILDIINLPEAQNARWLSEVLHRKMLFNGANALEYLYQSGYIHSVPVEKVLLAPLPNVKTPLKDILPYLTGQAVQDQPGQPAPTVMQDDVPAEYADLVAQEQAKLDQQTTVDPSQVKHNQHAENMAGDVADSNRQIANGLIAEAQMLEAEAARKRRMAEQYGLTTAKKPAMPAAPAVQQVEVTDAAPKFVDPATGREYKNESALKGAITRRKKAAKQ